MCRLPPGYVPQQKHLANLQQQEAKQPASGGVLRCELCGPDNRHEFSWMCESCGELVIDDGDKATKCPGCHAARDKKTASEPGLATESFLPKMKAVTEQTILRAAETGHAMALPQHTQEIAEKTTKPEDEILKLGKIEGSGIAEILERKKKELKDLQPKLPMPTQHLKDHGDVVNAIRELEEKGNARTSMLEEKKKENAAEEQKIRTEAEEHIKGIREKTAEQIKKIELGTEKLLAAKRDERVVIEKELLGAANEVIEKRVALKSKAAAVASELANLPMPPADAVLVPCLPGSIIHSNHIKPDIMLQAAMNDPSLLKSGLFSPEQVAMFTKWSLTYINQSSLLVPENQAAPAASSLQTTQGKEDAKAADAAKATDTAKRDAGNMNMEAEADLKRKAEEADNELTDESTDQDEKNEVESLNNREEGKPPFTKVRVNRMTKNERKANGKGTAKGSASVQKENQK